MRPRRTYQKPVISLETIAEEPDTLEDRINRRLEESLAGLRKSFLADLESILNKNSIIELFKTQLLEQLRKEIVFPLTPLKSVDIDDEIEFTSHCTIGLISDWVQKDIEVPDLPSPAPVVSAHGSSLMLEAKLKSVNTEIELVEQSLRDLEDEIKRLGKERPYEEIAAFIKDFPYSPYFNVIHELLNLSETLRG